MIPVKLSLKNFMCYKDRVPPLYFRGTHIACLCGDNGSGKSAIFDAMTWALWGECRASTIEELIYTGQNEMEVELEFLTNNRLFRVIRKYVRSSSLKTAKSTLDLQAFNDETYKSIGEQSILETQKKIINLLHLDYATFINSALLLQGRANEFSKKKPGERKEILANILDLDFYSEIERQSRAQADRKKGEEENLARDVAALAERINEKPGYEEAVTQAQAELLDTKNALTVNEVNIARIRRQKELLSAKEETIKQLRQQLAMRNVELQDHNIRLAALNKNIEGYNKAMTDKQSIEAGYREFKAVSERLEQLNEMLAKSTGITNRKYKLREIITSTLNLLTGERRTIQQQVTDLQAKADKLPFLREKLTALRTRQQEIEITESDLDKKRRLITEKSTLIGSLSASISDLSHSMQDIRSKLELMSHAGARCPLCESELGPEGHAAIEKKLNDELTEKASLQKDTNARIVQTRKELSDLEKYLKQKEPLFRSERDSIKQQIAIVEREIKEAQASLDDLPAKTTRLKQIDTDVRNRNYALEQHAALSQLELEETMLGYNQAEHEALKQKRFALLRFEELKAQLTEAELKLDAHKTTRQETCQEIARLEDIVSELQVKCDSIRQELVALPGLIQQLNDLEAQAVVLRKRERDAGNMLATFQEKIRQIDVFARNKQEKEYSINQLKEESGLYAELAAAFSKKGIQALLIEEALPDIENEANILLGKMTDNRMSLTIETQKGTKKGDMVETLEIKIADELGTRNYEMFSGGEAFRIDLALRIAISRLLVRRAGASLPLLVIDEGFGTQDSSSLEKLVEAINSIQDDFEKIFVITHLEELKDKFPLLINVSKTPDGSMISISQ